MANNVTVCVTVNSEPVYMTSADIRHQFTVGELRIAAAAYSIPVNGATISRNGQQLTDADILNDGDVVRTHFGKGEDGQR